ncbi:MAG: hypothetical protein ACH346_08560, partial [Chthoniobacterales bacterium]
MARYKLAQYAQPQNDFSTGLRTFQVCFAVLKIIFRPSPYANLLTPITVFRLKCFEEILIRKTFLKIELISIKRKRTVTRFLIG